MRTLTLAYKVIKGESFFHDLVRFKARFSFSSLQRTSIMHGMNDTMKLQRPWMTARPKLKRYRTNLSKTFGC